MFKKELHDWKEYRKLAGKVREFDCHLGPDHGKGYHELMEYFYDEENDK